MRPFKPRILAISADTRFLREVRLVLPLSALAEAGLAAGFRILDPVTGALSDHFPLAEFDAVIVQREPSPGVLEALAALGVPFLLDVDDLLVGRPSYSEAGLGGPARRRVLAAIAACAALTVTNARLLAELARLAGPLGTKASVVPNAVPGDAPPDKAATRPNALYWASSDRPALTASAPAVLGAVRDFAARHGLPVYLTGRFGRLEAEALPGARLLGNMDYWRHKYFLRQAPTAIGLAPLETTADPDTLAFIACKSDVKLLEYGGFGHPAVYSAAPPYADTELKAGVLAANTYEAWTEALEGLYASGYRKSRDEAARIFAARNAAKVAREAWLPAIGRVVLPRPLPLAAVAKAFRLAAPERPGAGEPLHHRFADRVYRDVYLRLTPARLRRHLGRALERFALGGD